MQKLVNTALDLATSGLEVVAIYVTGAATVAPFCKLILTLAPLAFIAVRLFWKHDNKENTPHVK